MVSDLEDAAKAGVTGIGILGGYSLEADVHNAANELREQGHSVFLIDNFSELKSRIMD